MEEKDVKLMLQTLPGARRAAQGVIIEVDEGRFFHITSMRKTDPDLLPGEDNLSGFCAKNEIIKLRNLRSSHDYLLRIRAEAIASSSRARRTFLKRKNLFEKNGRKWSLTSYYNSHNKHSRKYVSRLSRKNQEIIRAMPYGPAPIIEANAVAKRTLLGDVVICSESLQYFYYFMNIAMYGMYVGVPARDRIEASIIALRIMNSSESFDFDLDPRGIFPLEHENYFQELTARQMEFTFGHEFSHLLEGHLDADIEGLDLRTYAYDCEFSADYSAVKLGGSNKKARLMLVLGAIDVLTYLHFLERTKKGVNKTMSISHTHPPALDRIKAIAQHFEGENSFIQRLVIKNLDALEDMIKHSLDRLQIPYNGKDILEVYGSVYLPSFKKVFLRDRYDF